MNRKSGNQAQTTHSSPSISLSRRGILQRQCECGNAAGLSGKCEGCDSTRLSQPQGSSLPTHEQPPSTSIGYSFGQMAVDVPRSPVVQAKLTIGKPNDQYEQEADRVAKQVSQQLSNPEIEQSDPDPNIQRTTEPQDEEEKKLQRKPIQLARKDSSGGEAAPDLSSAINQARGHGKPLEAGLQNSMGQAMGADFSRVRVHTDAQADQLNRSIQAKAFTTGQDVFFRQGEYNPGSRGGQELIAHELTHVVQQKNSIVQRSPMHLTKQDSHEVIQRLPLSNAAHLDPGGSWTPTLDASGRAKKIVATNLKLAAGHNSVPSGSFNAPSVNPPSWSDLQTLNLVSGPPHYRRMHLLSDRLGGPGNTTNNLAPGTQSLNSSHFNHFEEPAMLDVLNQGHTIDRYEVEIVSYNTPSASLTSQTGKTAWQNCIWEIKGEFEYDPGTGMVVEKYNAEEDTPGLDTQANWAGN